MRRDPQKDIWDMLDAAERILSYVGTKTVAEYRESQITTDAVERCVTILGEALARLRQDAPDLAEQIAEQRAISSFRNILVHQYDIVDAEQVIDIVNDDLPALTQHLRLMLDRLDS